MAYLTINHNNELKKGDIPNSVTHLTFGKEFNQELKEGDIPNSATDLTFGTCFNQELKKGDIPNSVTHLTFGHDFNQELNILPSGLKSLNLCKNNQILSNLPFTLEKLIITNYNKDNYIKLPYGCVIYDKNKNIITI